MSPAEIRASAKAWYDKRMATIAAAHGPRWPDHKEWIEDYLREELRERLHDLGWRTPA